jgi:oligosaccharide repeat unit polymerase
MNLDVLIAALTILVIVNYRFRRSVLYPPFLFCAVWLLDATVYRLNLIEIDPLHAITMYVILAGGVLFSIGGGVAFFVPGKLVRTRLTLIGSPRSNGIWLKYMVVGVTVICVCLMVRHAMQLDATAGGEGFFFAVARNQAIENANAGRASTTWYSYIGTWAVFAAILFQADGSDRISISAVVIAFVSALLSGGRIGFLMLFSSLTCLYLMRNRKERFRDALRSARWFALCFLIVFCGMIFADKSVSTNGVSILAIAFEFLIQYIIGPSAALDRVLLHQSDYAGMSNHTFQIFLRMASAVHLIRYTPPPVLDQWIFVPFATNVYTYYKFVVTDFGISAALMITGCIGFIQTLLYRKAHADSIIGRYIFALSIYSLFMVIFDDAYSRFGMYMAAVALASAYLTARSIPWGIFSPGGDKESTVGLPPPDLLLGGSTSGGR